MKNKICCIFNYAPHYRKSIYKKMDEELTCDFFFGGNVPGTLKAMDTNELKGFSGSYKNVLFRNKIIWQKKILKLLFVKKYKNYILTVDTACLSSWIFIYLAKLLGKKVFFWTHGCYGNESNLYKLKNRLYFLSASGLLLYSEYAKEILLKEGYNQEKLHVIANSLDYENQLEIRQQLVKNSVYSDFFNNSDPVLLFIGRLEKKKKLSMILDLQTSFKNKGIAINVVFIGEGNDKQNLEEKALSLKLYKKVWFYGSCYDEKEIGNLIFNADICLSPGNVGLTAIHALSFGTPVITHANFCEQMPEFEAIMSGENGAFFEQNNMESLKEVVEEWLVRYPVKNNILVEKCYKVIDSKYNPNYQISVLKKVIVNNG
ncbi:glycosyltransferase [Wenyingzhuangia sp. IMCC45574]